jgi:hypothetical protein
MLAPIAVRSAVADLAFVGNLVHSGFRIEIADLCADPLEVAPFDQTTEAASETRLGLENDARLAGEDPIEQRP